MAYNKTTSKKKNNYLPTSLMDELSDELGKQVLLSEDFNLTTLKITLKKIWDDKKDSLSSYVYPKPIKEFEDLFYNILKNAKKEDIFTELNNIFDERRSANNVALDKAKRDLFGLWKNIAYGEKKNWDIPWIRETKLGEKFSTFEKNEERYVFKGYMNQMILLYNGLEQDKSSVVLFKGELQKLLNHDFKNDSDNKMPEEKQKAIHAFSKIKGIPSFTSLFVPKGYSKWIKEDGSSWKPEDKNQKEPTIEEIERLKLKKISNNSFISQPVWSVDDVKHLFAPEVQEKLKKLSELRTPKKDYFPSNEDIPFDTFINELMKQKIKEQGIDFKEEGSRAFYNTKYDFIQIPLEDDFKNPVFRYAVFSHELAHSTMHLLGRDPRGHFGNVTYAKEELIAESTAALLVKDLEEKIKKENNDSLPKKWQDFFEDYYKNAEQYGISWGRKFNFKDIFETIAMSEKQQSGVVSQLMKGVFDAYNAISKGNINDLVITPEMRKEVIMKNIDDYSKNRKRGFD